MDKQTEQARELLAQQRQQSDLRHDAMLERSEEELHDVTSSSTVEQKARAAMANKLHEQGHTQDAMRERSEEEVHGS